MAQKHGPEPGEQRPTTVDSLSVTAIRPPAPDGPAAAAPPQRPGTGGWALPEGGATPEPERGAAPEPRPEDGTARETRPEGGTAPEGGEASPWASASTATSVPAQRHVPKHAAKEPGETAPVIGVGVDILQSRPSRFEGLLVWLRRPAGRTVAAGVVIALLLGGAWASGKFLVPAVAKPRAGSSVPPPPSATPGTIETGEAPVPAPPTSTFTPPTGTRERPSDVLAAWAGPRAVKLQIPPVAMQAYGYAELITARTTPGCRLTWTTLAGIAKIESDHGRTNGSLVQEDGKSVPPIVGPPLDGQSNRQSIKDTDAGAIDTDKTWDRAVGPMQFLPSTWKQYGIDADADGVTDVNDIDDASLTAAAYLCANGRDLSTVEGWDAAIHSYNIPDEYRTAVFNATNDYGRRDRTG